VAGPITQQDQKQIAGLFGGSLAKMLTPIVSLFFTIAFLNVIIITLGALVVMLINRYITISLLLILLPLAWALWVFPYTSSYWREWWNRFIRWTFFAPIVLFFLYLCLLTLKATPGGEGDRPGVTLQNVNFTFNRTGPLSGLEAFGGSFLMNLMVPILNAIVMTGCVMGGLTAANKLGIKGAATAEALAKSTTKAIGMFAWNRTKGLGATGLNKLLPKTPPPPKKGGLVRALHTVGFKAGQLAERFGVREKIEETAEKYGPSTWPYLPKNWMQRKEKAKEIKGEIEKINKEIQSVMPTLLAKRQEELNALQQNLQKIDSEFNNQIQKQEAIIDAVKSRLETEMDINKRDQIKKELEAEEQKLNELISQRKTRVDEIDNQIKQKEKELELSPEEQPEIKESIARRRQKYQELRDLKPEGIFGVIVKSTLEPFQKKKQKVKIPKKAFEEVGIEIEEEKKEGSKQNQQSQGQKKP
jgi:membrane protease YdiL (CAAX protease family)